MLVWVYACRRVKKEETVHRSAASETAATTAGTLRGASLSHRRDTHVTTPWTGDTHTHT